MSKNKKRKEEKTKKPYQIELKGIFLILIAIIGCCPFGVAADIIKGFSAFLFGSWWAILLVLIGIIGLYMIVKREKPDYFNSKTIGFYIIIIGILVLSHAKYISEFTKEDLDALKVLETTIGNLMDFINTSLPIQGGGIIGALISIGLVKLLTIDGTKVVCIALIICGAIMFTGVSIYDIIKFFKNKAKNGIHLKNKQKEKQEIIKKEQEYEEDKKIVVSSVDQLIHITEDKKEETIEVEKKEEIKEEVKENINTGYKLPSLSLLNKPQKNKNSESSETIAHNVKVLEQVLRDFQIEAKVVAINPGPAVTQYELEAKSGTRLNKILAIHSEIALALAAKDVRIQAPIPGKSTIGIEIPNKVTSMVTVREILDVVPSNMSDSKLLVSLGRDIMGKPIFCEINKTPHLLVAGSTGSGKSVCINSIIISILMRSKPDEVKLVLVDPKKVELSMYNGVPHLLAPVVTEPKRANIALKKIVVEMERRYEMFSDSGTKNIAGYNAYVEAENKTRSKETKLNKLPFIVVIIDELADLMLVAAKEVEDSIMRITQMARAAGIHLIVATQRPSTDVITGVVKANIPSRISFAVSSQIDSRTIIDMAGAEKLLGKGDMLFLPQGENTPIRVQGTYLSDEEIKKVVDHTISQQKAIYDESLTMDNEELNATTMVDNSNDDYDEPLYNDIVEFVVTQGKASASLLQRRFRLGYNRAARCIDLLEERGIIGPNNGSKPREVLVKLEKNE